MECKLHGAYASYNNKNAKKVSSNRKQNVQATKHDTFRKCASILLLSHLLGQTFIDTINIDLLIAQ